MNILFVTNMYPTNDSIYNGIHVQEQIHALTQKYSLQHQIVFINGRQSKLNYLKSIFSINKLIRNNNFDIIHIHFGLSGIFLLFNPFLKTPSVVTLHGSDTMAGKAYGLMLPITKIVVKLVKKVIIMNEKMSDLFVNHKNKLVRIPCGIDVNIFDIGRHNNDQTFKIGFPSSKARLGKNFLLFKQIIDSLIIQGFQIEIVEFHDLTRAEVIKNLSILDCLLFTSLYEGSPQIIKEAMGAGVPIVSTNVGDVKYVLEGVNNCYIVDSFEADQFLKPMKKIILQKSEERFTNGKKKIIELQLDQDSVVSKLFKIYKDVIASNEKKA